MAVPERVWVVYRLRSVSGRLLYVGKTSESGFEYRLEEHRGKPWGWLIFDWEFQYFDTEEEALAVELEVIEVERPLANVVGQWDRGRAFERVFAKRMAAQRLTARRG